MKYIHELVHNGMVWVNVTRQQETELKEIQQRFGFEDEDIQESLPPFQRPKIVKRSHYYFMVLHFPIFDRETRRLGFTEIDFFLSGNYLVTVHSNSLFSVEHFFNTCRKDEAVRARYFSGTAAHMVFELLTRLFDAIFPILLHTNDDIYAVERKLFNRLPGKAMAEEILRLKTNTVTFRRTMQGHRTVMDRLVLYAGRELDLSTYQSYLNSLREFSVEIWHLLESQRESIDALHEASESLLTLRTNAVMRTLTIISVITFPLTLLATLFAIRAPGTPFVEMPYGFLIILFLTISGALGMLAFFKRRGWM